MNRYQQWRQDHNSVPPPQAAGLPQTGTMQASQTEAPGTAPNVPNEGPPMNGASIVGRSHPTNFWQSGDMQLGVGDNLPRNYGRTIQAIGGNTASPYIVRR